MVFLNGAREFASQLRIPMEVNESEVVYPRPEEGEELIDIQKQIQSLLTKHGRLGLAAVAHAVWNELDENCEEIEVKC